MDERLYSELWDLPDWVSMLIIQLGRCIEEKLAQGGDRLSSDLLVFVFDYFTEQS